MTYNVFGGTLNFTQSASTSATDCLERLVSEMTCYVWCSYLLDPWPSELFSNNNNNNDIYTAHFSKRL